MEQNFSSLQKTIAKSISWLVLFRVGSQTVSWIATIYIARILLPSDYGLMSMATLITGYAELFAEMGLGSAIIQQKENSQNELSSLFWFTVIVGVLLGAACFPMAHLTAYLMKEPRLISLTSAISIIFLLSSMQTVPLSLLRRDLNFKKMGLLEVVATLISIICMIFFAKTGFGVWTLLLGRILRQLIYVILLFFFAGWLPHFYFSIKALRNHLSFGIAVVLGRSLFYFNGKIDVFFAGRAWPLASVGLYDFSKELADIPSSKIMPLVNEAVYPAFAKLKEGNIAEFNRFFTRILKIMTFLFMPIYCGGALLAHELTFVLLDKKWEGIANVFALSCILKLISVMTALNGPCLTAKGKPKYILFFYMVLAIVYGITYWLTAPQGLMTMMFAQLVVILVFQVVWHLFSMAKLQINAHLYLHAIKTPLIATVTMGVMVVFVKHLLTPIVPNVTITLILLCLFAVPTYLLSCFLLERDFFLVVLQFAPWRKKAFPVA